MDILKKIDSVLNESLIYQFKDESDAKEFKDLVSKQKWSKDVKFLSPDNERKVKYEFMGKDVNVLSNKMDNLAGPFLKKKFLSKK